MQKVSGAGFCRSRNRTAAHEPARPHQLVPLPQLVAAAGDRASMRFLEFFAANIRNPHTRRAYARAAEEFLAWCASAGVWSITDVQAVHVATWIEAATRELRRRASSNGSPRSGISLIGSLPARWCRLIRPVRCADPGTSSRRDKRPCSICRKRALLDSIGVTTHPGLRDRALIGLMAYSFARIGAALGMAVEDVYTQNRRLWVRLREKGGKRHAMPLSSQPGGIPHRLSGRRRPARRSQGAAVPHDRARHRQAHAHGAPASERLCDDRPARGGCRH
jgi:integrase